MPVKTASKSIKAKPENNKILYEFLSPTYEVCCEEPLYYKFKGDHCYYSFNDGNVYLKKRSSVSLLTYFNAFSAMKWGKYTNVDEIAVFLEYRGDAVVDAVFMAENGTIKLASWKISSDKNDFCQLPLEKYASSGLIGINIRALGDFCLFGGGYITNCEQTQTVRLGISITTYKREDRVRQTIDRLDAAINTHPAYKYSIGIALVDNGRTLTQDEVPGCQLIQNRNLGGTGGFMRGLIYFKDQGNYTHCLFMDDDCSCEPGSIFRTINFLRHATNPATAISGAMLSENIQFMQWENGAWFDMGCHPLHCDYDLRDPKKLIENEMDDDAHKLYGAWWFFAFPLAYVKKYVFPFFVRGDDIQFSYLNNFLIVRMNGISVWQEDFKTKESPQTLYMDIRSHVMHHILLNKLDNSPTIIINMVREFFNRFNDSYQYDTANSIVQAFLDVQKGIRYWEENLEMDKIREKIKNNIKIENYKNSSKNLNKYKLLKKEKNKVHNEFLRNITLNGHLLPRFLLNNKNVKMYKYDIPDKDCIYLNKNVMVENHLGETIFLSKNSRKFLINNIALYLASILFKLKYKRLQSVYTKFMENMNTDEYWKNIFGINQDNKNENTIDN